MLEGKAAAAAARRRKSRHPKKYGYDTEIAALVSLSRIFPKLRREGSVAFSKAAADLVQDEGRAVSEAVGPTTPLRLVVTRDKRRPLLVTMSADDAARLAIRWFGPVVVQVKARERTWIGGLYDALVQATK